MEIILIAWRQRSTRVSADQWNEDSRLRVSWRRLCFVRHERNKSGNETKFWFYL